MSEVPDAVETWRRIYTAWDDADPTFNEALNQHEDDLLAASMIEADRQAVREQTVAEIAAWLREGEKEFSDCDIAAHLLETGMWKQ